MNKQKFLIAGGNSTLLIESCPIKQEKRFIDKYLGEVEQIGFIKQIGAFPELRMMGNELCINSTLAFAYLLSGNGQLKTSGLNNIVKYRNEGHLTAISFKMPYVKCGEIVLFEGIGFVCKTKRPNALRKLLEKLSYDYKKPAFGLALYANNQLTPYVYVKETDSLFKETACGSGSIALSIFTGYKVIIQPTGETIKVNLQDGKFTVKSKVVKIGESL